MARVFVCCSHSFTFFFAAFAIVCRLTLFRSLHKRPLHSIITYIYCVFVFTFVIHLRTYLILTQGTLQSYKSLVCAIRRSPAPYKSGWLCISECVQWILAEMNLLCNSYLIQYQRGVHSFGKLCMQIFHWIYPSGTASFFNSGSFFFFF